jgi:formylglycine-generating enzyme required for sulfatase activity
LDNDSDPDDEPLSVALPRATSANGGVLSVSRAGTTIDYVPPAYFSGFDTFSYNADDGKEGLGTGNVTIWVTPAPVAQAAWPDGSSAVRTDVTLRFSANIGPTSMVEVQDGGASRAANTLLIGENTVSVRDYIQYLNFVIQHSSFFNTFADSNGAVWFGGVNNRVQLFDPQQTREREGNRELFDYAIEFDGNQFSYAAGKQNFPILGVTWFGAASYCNFLTALRGVGAGNHAYVSGATAGTWTLRGLAAADFHDGLSDPERSQWADVDAMEAYRLPLDGGTAGHSTHNEWLLAAIGAASPAAQPFAVDDGGNYFNSGDHFDNGPTPADYFPANDQGVQDMSGNVWEWLTETAAAGAGYDTFVRGGSWYSNPTEVTVRASIDPAGSFSDTGFRVAMSYHDFAYQVEVGTVNGGFTALERNYNPGDAFDYGQTTHSWAPSVLQPNTQYAWRVRVYDYMTGTFSDWVTTAFETTDQNSDEGQQLDIEGGWNLVSLGVDPSTRHPKHLFGFQSTTWVWDGTQYVNPLELGEYDGFWLFFPTSATIIVRGFSPEKDTYRSSSGWNLFGAPYLIDRPTDPRVKEIFTYQNGDYTRVVPGDTIESGFGLWMYTSQPTTIDFPALDARQRLQAR